MTDTKCTNKDESVLWEKHVPIKVSDGTTFAYLNDEISIPALYSELVHKLYTATPEDNFVLIINNGGGVVETAIMLVDAMKRSAATVNVLVTGFAASAATIIALAADNLEISDHTAFMIHNYSAGMGGKGHELKARQAFMDKSLNVAFKSYYEGFLTEAEMDEVIEGKDFWMDAEEVRTRWDNRLNLRGN